MIEKYYTANELAEMLNVDPEKIRDWIHSGELEAMNLASSKHAQRPSWRIGAGAICKFLSTRATITKREAPRKQQKKSNKPTRRFV